ncbi:expansin-A12 [Asparagus officinalis]|uniref:expansin-A12 n=1 Tax=Asparagus officinalis TaxID=4686 RepID=UPI00098E275D|nr:expansin-A12 [Asparagus officinalis]
MEGIMLILAHGIFFLLLEIEGVQGKAAGGWLPAHATFYGASQNPTSLGGACGYDNTFHSGFGINTAALSAALFRQGQACGACFQITCDRRADPRWCLPRTTVTVTATNFCPPNNNGGWCDPPHRHFDMSLAAFSRVALVGSEGIVPVLYRRVPCRRSGGVRFTLKGTANFNLVMFTNVGGSGDVKAAWVKGSSRRSSAWTAMQRNWGANWQTNIDFRNQALSFKLMLGDRKTLEFVGVVPSSWKHGETYAAKSQFSN